MTRTIRAGLAGLYFELIVTPGAEARYMKMWADTFVKLIPNRAGERRKLEPSDLQLPWRDLGLCSYRKSGLAQTLRPRKQ